MPCPSLFLLLITEDRRGVGSGLCGGGNNVGGFGASKIRERIRVLFHWLVSAGITGFVACHVAILVFRIKISLVQ